MNETLLLPTDGSETIDAVVDHASDVATRRDAAVHVLYVLDDRAFLTLDDARVGDVIDQLSAEGTGAVDDVEAALTAEGLT